MNGSNEQAPALQTGGGAPDALSFYYGHPDPEAFPLAELQAAIEATLQRHVPAALLYGPEQGPSLLLDILCQKLLQDEGLRLRREHLFITAGASQGLDLICRLWTRPGDAVLVEAPSYHEAIAVLRDYPVRLAAVPLDDEGLIVEALAERLQELRAEGRHAAFLYTIPTFQNPSGVTMSAARRQALAALARAEQLWIAEDDVYRDLCYEGTVPPSLFELAGGQSVLRLGSFSKTLAPGLRLGWVLAAPEAVARLAGSGLRHSAGGANPFTAYVVAEFCRAGHLEPHVARLVARYRARRDAMLEALAAAMPPGVTWTRPQGGFFLWLTLPEPLTARAVLVAAQARGITFPPGEPFFAEGGGERHIRLPFSYVNLPDIIRGMAILGQAIRAVS
ncbi:MAG: PLP-dependent aminotransferase family protein [Chloroflexi bacterium]|nr:PLP-dependent aminotransferase family protein [Chloroflexota bacterium]